MDGNDGWSGGREKAAEGLLASGEELLLALMTLLLLLLLVASSAVAVAGSTDGGTLVVTDGCCAWTACVACGLSGGTRDDKRVDWMSGCAGDCCCTGMGGGKFIRSWLSL